MQTTILSALESSMPCTEGRHNFGIKLGQWYPTPAADNSTRSLLGDCKH